MALFDFVKRNKFLKSNSEQQTKPEPIHQKIIAQTEETMRTDNLYTLSPRELADEMMRNIKDCNKYLDVFVERIKGGELGLIGSYCQYVLDLINDGIIQPEQHNIDMDIIKEAAEDEYGPAVEILQKRDRTKKDLYTLPVQELVRELVRNEEEYKKYLDVFEERAKSGDPEILYAYGHSLDFLVTDEYIDASYLSKSMDLIRKAADLSYGPAIERVQIMGEQADQEDNDILEYDGPDISDKTDDELYGRAYQLYTNEKYSKSLSLFKVLADKGHAKSQYYIGLAYNYGNSVPEDEQKSFRWMLKSAQNGYFKAQQQVAEAYHVGKGTSVDIGQYLYWILRLAERGNIHAQYEVAVEYQTGDTVERDLEKAAFWLKKVIQDTSYVSYDDALSRLNEIEGTISSEQTEAKQSDKNDDELFEEGMNAYNAGNYTEAFYIWKPLAQKGHPMSQFRFGRLYARGEGVTKDYEQALLWFEQAGQNGVIDAQFNCGLYYRTGKCIKVDYVLSLYWYEKAANQNDAEAQYWCGVLYSKPVLANMDKDKAISWLESSVKDTTHKFYREAVALLKELKEKRENQQPAVPQVDDDDSLYEKAMTFYNAQNFVRAIPILEELAHKGNIEALCTLGDIYEKGIAVRKDKERAFSNYLKAAQAGCIPAQEIIATYYDIGFGTDKNEEQSMYWQGQIALQGTADDMFEMGNKYSNCYKVQGHNEKAYELWEKAALQGHLEANVKCAEYYRYSKNDKIKVLEWYYKAEEQGYPDINDKIADVQYDLGKEYYYQERDKSFTQHKYGSNVATKDKQKALEWYLKAADRGNCWAYIQCGFLYKEEDLPEYNVAKANKYFEKGIELENELKRKLNLSMEESKKNAKEGVLVQEQTKIAADVTIEERYKFLREDNDIDTDMPIRVAIIGEEQSGKSTLLSALANMMGEDVPYSKLKAPLGNVSRVQFDIGYDCYEFTDCTGVDNLTENIIGSRYGFDGAILVVPVCDYDTEQIRKQLTLLRKTRLYSMGVVTYISKADITEYDYESFELAESDVRAILEECGYASDDAPVIYGSAEQELTSGNFDSVNEIMAYMRECIFAPEPLDDRPFMMLVEDVFKITGRGVVAEGIVEQGIVSINTQLELVGINDEIKKVFVTGIEMKRKLLDSAKTGDRIGILLRGVEKSEVHKGQILCRNSSYEKITAHSAFSAVVCLDEGADVPETAVFNIRNLNCDGSMKIIADNDGYYDVDVQFNVPVALQEGQRFIIRNVEDKIIGFGVVSDL